MSNSELAVASQENPFVRASTALSQQLGLEPRALIDAIKTQFFKGKEATDAQLAVVVSTARALGLNPLLPGQLYPYPDRSGAVTIMLGPDGIFTLLANNSDIVAQKDGGPAYWTEHGKDGDKDTCTGFINHRTKGLLKKTIWVDEWVVGTNPNWSSRRHHMSEVRALKQAARMVVHGIPPDSDEQKLGELTNVTGTGDQEGAQENAPEVKRPEPAPRAKRGAAGAKAAEVVVTPEQQKQADPTVAPVTVVASPENIQAAMQAREAKVAEKVAEPAKPEPAKAEPVAQISRAFLTEGERYVTTAKVDDFKAIAASVDGQNCAAIRAILSGGYVGEVRQKEGGAKFVNNNTEVVALPPWQVGAILKFALVGKKASNGKIIPWVESVSAAGSEPENLD